MQTRVQTLTIALDHLKAGRFEPCAALCRPLLAADPDDVDARFFLGVCLATAGRIDEAIAFLTRVIETMPAHPDARRELARMLQAQGLALVDRGQLDAAIAAFGRGAAADPANAAAHANLAQALSTEGRFAESLAASHDALRLSPGDITININHAVTLLKSGRLLEGWAANEWRHKRPGREKLPPTLMLPKLRQVGSPKGRTIVVYHEEGFGDTIQFLRYAQLLTKAGARVILWAPPELVRLLRGQADIAEVLTGNIDLPKFDYHCPIISLPYIFETGLETIPAPGPYIRADRALASRWSETLPGGRRIGLVWSGEPRPYDPAAQALDRRRSLPFNALTPLLRIPGLTFVSLQFGAAAGQAATTIHDPMPSVKDFADTAAIIANLDLVVAVDTAVAHLAAAMGKPVFLLDRYDNCWRWLHGREDSPWYPSLRIFRQRRMGDWSDAIAAAAAALEAFARDG